MFDFVDAGQFANGDTNAFSSNQVMHTWQLANLNLPHSFVSILTMAETDPSGGFANITRDVMAGLDAENSVKAAVATL